MKFCAGNFLKNILRMNKSLLYLQPDLNGFTFWIGPHTKCLIPIVIEDRDGSCEKSDNSETVRIAMIP